MLGVSEQHAQRIASSRGGRRLANHPIVYHRLEFEVETYVLDARHNRRNTA